VWANNNHQVGDIIVGPYFKKNMRTFVVRTGSATDQKMVMNRTNLSEDYKKAFAESPPDGIYGVAIFTDNDDTREPITALATVDGQGDQPHRGRCGTRDDRIHRVLPIRRNREMRAWVRLAVV